MTSADWPTVRDWRRRTRTELVERRRAVGDDVRSRIVAQVDRVLRQVGDGADLPVVAAFYWPIRGEVALFAPMRAAIERGVIGALPVVIGPDRPLAFRRWAPGSRMVRGVWGIPVPAADERVTPTVLFVPVVGFDDDHHRLGNGGGYYDRTLADLREQALCVGVGMECLRLPSIRPQQHDVSMHLVVTESRPDRTAPLSLPVPPRRGASPPCSLEDLPPDLRGF